MNILLLGANSDVARAVAARFAEKEHARIFLASRNRELLDRTASDLTIRFQVETRVLVFDALETGAHAGFYNALDPKPDIVVVAFGYFGDQAKAQQDFPEARLTIDTNFTGAASILEIIAADFEKRGHGCIIGIGSVAGLRGRQSNYIYGAAKAAFAVYLSGLRNRLSKKGVHVMTVLPGFIDTKMTEGLDLPGLLTAKPETVAGDIYRAWRKKRNMIYTRWFWRWIMLIIRSIPETVFKKMSL